MTTTPGMMLWTDAYLGDTSHLTTLEHGAYLLILMAMWRAGGSLPDDDARLARCAGLSRDKWRRIAPTIRELLIGEDGRVTQKRLRREWRIACGRSEKASAAGRSSAAVKRLKSNDLVPTAVGRKFQLARNLTETKTKTKNSSPCSQESHGESLGDFSADAFERFWSAFPHKVGRGAAASSFRHVAQSRKVGFEALMAGLTRYIAAKPPERAWLNPATFLDQERWQDEPAPPPQSPFSGAHYAERAKSPTEFSAKPLAEAVEHLRHFAAGAHAPDLGASRPRDDEAGGDPGPAAAG
jgi:uncharacterized protein YdaU (DUF1376 family)